MRELVTALMFCGALVGAALTTIFLVELAFKYGLLEGIQSCA